MTLNQHRFMDGSCSIKTVLECEMLGDQSDLQARTRSAPVELEQSISPRCHSQVIAAAQDCTGSNLNQVLKRGACSQILRGLVGYAGSISFDCRATAHRL